MEKVRKSYPDIAPVAGQFSRAIRSGDFLFIAGCTARGSDAERGPMLDQFKAVVNAIKGIVEAEGGSVKDLVRFTTYITSLEEWNACATERQAFFEGVFQGEYPTNTLLEIKGLALPNFKIEIEATALL